MRKGNLFPEAIEGPAKAVELGCFCDRTVDVNIWFFFPRITVQHADFQGDSFAQIPLGMYFFPQPLDNGSPSISGTGAICFCPRALSSPDSSLVFPNRRPLGSRSHAHNCRPLRWLTRT